MRTVRDFVRCLDGVEGFCRYNRETMHKLLAVMECAASHISSGMTCEAVRKLPKNQILSNEVSEMFAGVEFFVNNC